MYQILLPEENSSRPAERGSLKMSSVWSMAAHAHAAVQRAVASYPSHLLRCYDGDSRCDGVRRHRARVRGVVHDGDGE